MAKGQIESDSDSKGIKAMVVFGVLLLILPLIVYWRQMEKFAADDSAAVAVTVGAEDPIIADSPTLVLDVPPENPDLDWIIAAHMEALGGKERLLKANTMVVETNVVLPDGKLMQFVSMRKRPRSVFQKMRTGNTEMSMWSDGSKAWEEKKRGGEVVERRRLSDEEFQNKRISFDFDNPIVRYVFSEHYPEEVNKIELRLEGEGDYAGKAGYWVTLLDDVGSKNRMFLNKDTMLIDFKDSELGDFYVSNVINNYSEVEGLMMPFQYKIKSSDRDTSVEINVKRYRFNKFMYDALFRPKFADELNDADQ